MISYVDAIEKHLVADSGLISDLQFIEFTCFPVDADLGLMIRLQSHAHYDHAHQPKHAFLSVKIYAPMFFSTRKYEIRSNGFNQ